MLIYKWLFQPKYPAYFFETVTLKRKREIVRNAFSTELTETDETKDDIKDKESTDTNTHNLFSIFSKFKIG